MANGWSQVLEGNPRAIARALSVVEQGGAEAERLLGRIEQGVLQEVHVIGLTGAPGAGKSSLSDALVGLFRRDGERVAVIAVDPSSPFSGGAVLGDRVRMMRHTLDDGVFIRSMGSRGSLGGLARPVRDAIKVLAAGGFHKIVLETVGVGQSELDVMYVADTVVVVLTPAGGDQVQAAKAGVMETADLLIVNKADLPGAERMKGELEDMVKIKQSAKRTWDLGTFSEWSEPVLLTSAPTGDGVEGVAQALSRHRAFLAEANRLDLRRGRGRLQELRERLEERVVSEVRRLWVEDTRFDELKQGVVDNSVTVSRALMRAYTLMTHEH